MKIRQVEDYLHALPTYNAARTDDRFLAGNPDRELAGMLVCWEPTVRVLRRAIERQCNLVVTHEGLYYTEQDESLVCPADPGVRLRKELVESAGLTVLRCHGTWDRYPNLGVHAAWVRGLGWEAQYQGRGVCRVGPQSLRAVAEHVAARLRPLGLEAVQVVGDLNATVMNVGVGTGVLCGLGSLRVFQKAGVDTVIVTEIWYATDDRWAEDVGLNLIVAEHYLSEAWGIENLAACLQKAFSAIPVFYEPSGCSIKVVSAPA